MLQLKKATEVQDEDPHPSTTAATLRQSQVKRDMHTGRALAVQVRLAKAQQHREARIEGLRWGSTAYWKDRIRECFLTARAAKYYDEAIRLRLAIKELQEKIVQPDELQIRMCNAPAELQRTGTDKNSNERRQREDQCKGRKPAAAHPAEVPTV